MLHFFSKTYLLLIVSVSVLVSAGSIYFIILTFFRPELGFRVDYSSFLTGINIIKSSEREKLYDLDLQMYVQGKVIGSRVEIDDLVPTIHPPLVLLLYLPLGGLPAQVSYQLFLVFYLFLVSFILFYLLKVFGKFISLRRMLLMFFAFTPVYFSISNRQPSLLLSLVTLTVYFCMKKSKSLLSGVSTSFLAFKPQYLLLAPLFFLITKKKKKFALGFVTSLLIIFVINISITGIESFSEYFRLLSTTDNYVFGNIPSIMFTIHGLISGSFPYLSNWTLLIDGVSYVMLIVYIYLMVKKNIVFDNLFASSIVLSIPFFVHTLVHDLAILLVPIFIVYKLASLAKQGKRRDLYILVFATLFLIPLFIYTKTSFYSIPFALGSGILLLKLGEENSAGN